MARLIDADELLRRIRLALKDTSQREVALDWLVATINQMQTEKPLVLEQMEEANKECGRLLEKYQNERIMLEKCIVAMCLERTILRDK